MPSTWTAWRPGRVVGRAAQALRSGPSAIRNASGTTSGATAPAIGASATRVDSWLEHYASARLQELDAACAGGGPEAFALFRDLDIDSWALLLTKQYELYPNIRALLPDLPDPALQEVWNGTSGVALAAQSAAFYRKLTERFEDHSDWPLHDCGVLDFGCGWGRLTRFLARDVQPGRLYGCDPVKEILDVCRETRVPATLAQSDFVPEQLPFEARFELAFSFSVFTHLSEAAHLRCLQALHRGLRSGGLLVLTVRPPEYLHVCELMQPVLHSLGNLRAELAQPRYLFAAHPTAPMQTPQHSREQTYGEAVVTMPYVRERWSELFDLLDVDFLLADIHQVMLTLRAR